MLVPDLLVSTVNMLYLHASPSPTPCIFRVYPICVFPLLSCRCHYSVFHPRGNLRCLLSVLLDVRCLRDCYYRSSKGLERDRRYRINGPKTPQ